MSEVTTEELVAAAETLSKFAAMVEGFHPEHPLASEAMQMKLFMTLANIYLLDFVRQRVAGLEPLDALLVTLKGDTPLLSPEGQKSLEESARRHLQ